MVNQSNGPAVVKWLNIFVQLVTGGHIWSPVVTLVTIKVKDLNNDSLYGIYYQTILVTAGHTWSHWSLSRSGTSTMMALMVIKDLYNLVTLVVHCQFQ